MVVRVVMSARCLVFVAALVTGAGTASAQSFETDVAPLVQASCVQCHGVRTVTPLSLAGLDFDLTDHHTFQAWEQVYARLERGEMPPAPRSNLPIVTRWSRLLPRGQTKGTRSGR